MTATATRAAASSSNNFRPTPNLLLQILTYDETFAYGINPDAFLGKQEERLQGSRSPTCRGVSPNPPRTLTSVYQIQQTSVMCKDMKNNPSFIAFRHKCFCPSGPGLRLWLLLAALWLCPQLLPAQQTRERSASYAHDRRRGHELYRGALRLYVPLQRQDRGPYAPRFGR